MFTMSTIDPALIILVNIYADQFSDRQETNVYNNGVMQVRVFVSVNYNGEASDIEIIKYVQNNVVIYSLNYGGNVQWQKSTIDNGFLHDTKHDANKSPPKQSDIRAVLYFTVPGGTAEGEHKWIAKLDGKQTSTKTPLTITVEPFEVSAGDLELVKRASVFMNCVVLYVLKYKKGVFPITQKLTNCTWFKGIKFWKTGGHAWVSMVMSTKGHKMGAFVEYRETSNIQIGKRFRDYSRDELVVQGSEFDECGLYDLPARINSFCIDSTVELNPADVDAAWNEGVVMLQVREEGLGIWCFLSLDAEENDFVLQDTFGGRVEVNINWDAGDWWGKWAIRSAKVVYP